MPDRRQHLCLLTAALLAVGGGIAAPAAGAEQQNLVELTLPRAPADDEAVWLQIQAGVLAPGSVIRVSRSDGELLGSVAPYGSSRGAPSATYLVPLPKSAIVDGRIKVRLTVEQPGKPSRAPGADEVESVVPVYVPVTK
jgi:hypothetical protein